MPATPEQIVAMYARAEQIVARRVARALSKGLGAPDWALRKQLELQGIKRWVALMPDPAVAAQDAYAETLLHAYVGAGSKAVTRHATRQQVLERIASNSPAMLPDFKRAAMRSVEDVYREVIAAHAGDLKLGATTLRESVSRSVDDFSKRGVTAFRDKAGRRWGIRTYAEMAVKTGAVNAQRAAHLDTYRSKGMDLIRISTAPKKRRSGSTTCSTCEEWEGKVLSITGETDGYPTLAEAEADGLFHPNCHHKVAAHIDVPDEDLETILARAKKKPKPTTTVRTDP